MRLSSCCLGLLLASHAIDAAGQVGRQPRSRCGNPLAFQVLLSRAHFSPGEIDGKLGTNASHALAAFQQSRNLRPTGQPDCDTWHALSGETSGPTTVVYTVTEDDLKGPFSKAIPQSLVAQATLPSLAYSSPLEALAERFHVSPGLFRQLNERALAVGHRIHVPAVTPFDPNVKPAAAAASDEVTVTVSRGDSALRVTRPDGTIIFFAPVTTGSEHDPLPLGNWKVTGVDWHPVFHYNPTLFWDAKPTDSRVTIKSGPNNPVGVMWIDLDLPHYGLHGTPEPGHIGHTESHGCVRLTNWDVVALASLVRVGTPVIFQ